MNRLHRIIIRLLICCALALILKTDYASAQEPVGIDESTLPILEKTEDIDIATPESLTSSNTLKWTYPYQHPTSTNFLRFHIRARGLPANQSWQLIIKDKTGAISDVVTAASFYGDPPNMETWTKRVPGIKANFQLCAEGDISGLRLKIDKVNISTSPLAQQAICGKDQRQDLVEAFGRNHRYYDWSKSIAILYFIALQDNKGTNCTGFLLTPNLLLTNYHCISHERQLPSAEAVFGFESMSPPRQDKVGVAGIVKKDRPLDFSLLRLKSSLPAWAVVEAEFKPVELGQRLIVIQHPEGSVKTISVKDCVVQVPTIPGRVTDFFHLCDTEGGASGSPVMDERTGKVVGLHHIGFTNPDPNKSRNLAIKIQLVMEKIKPDTTIYNEIITANPSLKIP